jgi:hypothetical protein
MGRSPASRSRNPAEWPHAPHCGGQVRNDQVKRRAQGGPAPRARRCWRRQSSRPTAMDCSLCTGAAASVYFPCAACARRLSETEASPPSSPAYEGNGVTDIAVVIIAIGAATAVVLCIICVAFMWYDNKKRRGRRLRSGPGGPPEVIVQGPLTLSRKFKRAEALVHVQRSRIRAKERKQGLVGGRTANVGAGGDAKSRQPQVLCLASVDQVTGRIQPAGSGSIPGKYIDVSTLHSARDSAGSAGAASDGESARDRSPARIARDWLSGKMRRAERGEGAPNQQVVNARLARARSDAMARAQQAAHVGRVHVELPSSEAAGGSPAAPGSPEGPGSPAGGGERDSLNATYDV